MDNMLQITNTCSAQCTHCPYVGSLFESQEVSFSEIEERIITINSDFILISGGEPLESEYFLNTLMLLDQLKIPYRIATGGHVSIKSFMSYLLNSSYFLGFSIGTDTISNRNKNRGLYYLVWLNNLDNLIHSKIPFSLTITIGEDLDLGFLFARIGKFLKIVDFIMINEKEESNSITSLKRDLEIILKDHTNVRIKYGYKN